MAMASLLGKSSASNGAMLTNNKRASIVDRYDQAKALSRVDGIHKILNHYALLMVAVVPLET